MVIDFTRAVMVIVLITLLEYIAMIVVKKLAEDVRLKNVKATQSKMILMDFHTPVQTSKVVSCAMKMKLPCSVQAVLAHVAFISSPLRVNILNCLFVQG